MAADTDIGESVSRVLALMRDVSLAADESQAIRTYLDHVRETDGWDYAEAWVTRPGTDDLVLHDAFSGDGAAARLFRAGTERLGSTGAPQLVKRVFERREPDWLADVTAADAPRFDRVSVAREAGLRSAVGVPVFGAGERVFAVCVFLSSRSRETQPDIAQLNVDVARYLGAVIQRLQVERTFAAAEARYQRIIESQTDLIAVLSPALELLYVNLVYADYWGEPPEQIIGTSLIDRVRPERRDFVRGHFACLSPENPVLVSEKDWHRSPDDIRVIEWTERGVFDEAGELVEICAIGRDITERRERQQALARSEAHFREIFERSPVAMWVEDYSEVKRVVDALREKGVADLEQYFRDHEGELQELVGRIRVVDANDAVARMYGRENVDALLGSQQRLLSDNPAEIIDIDFYAKEIAALARGEPRADLESVVTDASGATRTLRCLTNVPPAYDGTWERVITFEEDITERRLSEKRLAESEARFRQIAETIDDVFWISDPHKTRMIYVSRAYEDIWGRRVDSLLSDPTSFIDAIHPDDRERVRAAIARQAVRYYEEQYRIVRPDGEVRWIHDRGYPVRGNDGTVASVVGVARDITAQRDLEKQYLHAQRMEAVGQLTGGVAHDFNNLLTAALGYVELILTRAREDGEERFADWAETARRAILRGSDLNQRLLAFARRQVLEPDIIDVGGTVAGMHDMLQRMLGEQVEVAIRVGDGLPAIRVDPGQLESAVVNLAVNARDAMPAGGRLTIDAGASALPERNGAADAPDRGRRYVYVTVADTGEGIPADIRDRVFEPFFTTKQDGKGSGLGLSMVYGFATQSGGHVAIDHATGGGTAVTMYFPAHEPDTDAASPVADAGERDDRASDLPSGAEGRLVLVVEDQPDVRSVVVAMLEAVGCEALTAASGPEALAVLRDNPAVELLFTDVVMPGGMNGLEVVQKAREIRPGIPVIYTSGHAEEAMRLSNTKELDGLWLPKPYDLAQLAERLAEAFGEGA